MSTINKKQLHAGDGHFGKIWHTSRDGTYWTGDMSHSTAAELLQECMSTMRDLLLDHPELTNKPEEERREDEQHADSSH